MRVSSRGTFRAVGIIGAVALLSGFLCGVAFVSPVVATALVLVLALIDGAVLPPTNRLPRGSWALLFASLLLWSWFAWIKLLDAPIVVSTFDGEVMATAVVILPPLAAVFALGPSMVVVALANGAPRAIGALARVLAVTAGIAAVVLAVFVVGRVVRHPAANDYVSRLTVVGTFDASGLSCHGDVVRACTGDIDAGDAVVHIACSANVSACKASLWTTPVPDVVPPDRIADRTLSLPPTPLVVRKDEANGLYLLGGERQPTAVVAFSRDGAPRNLRARDAGAAIAPQYEVTGFAIVAALLALGGAAWVVQRRRAARRLLDAVEATVDDAGWLSFAPDAGVEPVRVADVRPGPVLVLGTRRGDAYRGAGAADVVPTSHAEVRAELRSFEDQLASSLAIAIPAALVPVVVAAYLGIVI